LKKYTNFIEILPHLSSKLKGKETFVKEIRDYRNDLTHGNIISDEIVNDDLYWNYKNLQLFLHLCILSQLGFSNEEIKEFIS
jgi:ApeA N-terminal domain 1